MSDEASVIPLFGQPTEGKPDPELVEELRDILARAERGEIAAYAIATVSPGHELITKWYGGHGTRCYLGHCISVLHHRYVAADLERGVPVL